MNTRFISAVCGCLLPLLLSACDEQPDEQQVQSGQNSQIMDERKVQQQQIEKYNAYIDAINHHSPNLERAIDWYENTIMPRLRKGDPKRFSVEQDTRIGTMSGALEKALALPGSLDDLDTTASAYKAALDTLKPLSNQLNTISASSAYLVDNGQKALELSPAYLAALHDALAAQEAFNAVIDRKDRENIKRNFEETEPGTNAYYHAGIAYYAKVALDGAGLIADEATRAQGIEILQSNVNELNALADAWWENGSRNHCSSLQSALNIFMSQSRRLLVDLQNGTYDKRPKALPSDLTKIVEGFNRIASGLNERHCIKLL